MHPFILAVDRRAGMIASLLARVLLALAVVAGLWQVVTRFVLQEPAVWTEITTRTLLIWSVFLGVVGAIRRGALVSVDLLMQLLGQHRALRLVVATLQASFLGLLTYVGSQMAWASRFQTMVGLEIPMTWGYLAIPAGSMLGIVATYAHYIDPRNGELEAAT